MKKIGVILPIYKTDLTEEELASLKRLDDVLGKEYDCYIIAPQKINESYFSQSLFQNFHLKFYKDIYFDSPYSYSFLLESKFFWEEFSIYEYILIYQLDCWIFKGKDELEKFVSQGYDYYGAPFLVYRYLNTIYRDLVGNGGLSIRKVSKMIEITGKYGPQMIDFADLRTPGVGLNCIPEDMYFSLFHREELSFPPHQEARKFSIEYFPEIFMTRNNGELPFGCHKVWDYYSFWKDYMDLGDKS